MTVSELVLSILCRLALHAWDKWAVVERHEVTRASDGTQVIGRAIVQERQCSACGLTQHRSSTLYIV